MSLRLRTCALASALLLAGASIAAAQADAPKPVSFTGDLGFVSTAGNTSVTTLSVGDKLVGRTGKVVLTQLFSLIYGRNEGEENANSILFRGRLDYPLSGKLSLYGFGGYERNKFAGIARRFDEGAGLAYKAWRHPKNELSIEAGLGQVQESRYLTGSSGATGKNNFTSGRAAAAYKHLFTKTAYLSQTLEYLPNLENSDDYRINSESALVAPLSSHFGLKMAYLIKYNALPPSAGLEKTDRLFTTGVQVTY
jgi:putative salt-induced outer membrane protein